MIRNILVCYHFLNVLILISLVMIIMIIETNIVPQGLFKKVSVSNRRQVHYKHESEQLREVANLQEDISKTENQDGQITKVVYTSANDTLLPLLSPDMKDQYGGFQEVGGMSGVFAYSANFDYRSKPPGIQVVVIFPYPNITSEFVCVLTLSTESSIRVMGQLKHFPEPNWHYKYRSGAVFCPLPTYGTRPKTVSLLAGDEDPVHNLLPVRYPEHRKYNLTRCYPAFHSTFGNVSALIWNIEISRVFGVDKFIFYNYDMNETVSRVLLQYQKEGLVEVRNWHIPVNYSWLHYWGQLACMHDCFYSQVGQSRFILFADIDELVIPRKVTSLVRLAEILLFDTTFTYKMFGALVFRNVFFPIILPKGEEIFQGKSAAEAFDISPLLHTIHSRVHAGYDRSKLLVIPEAIEFLWIHSVEKFRENWIPRVVDGDVALLHHYRYAPAMDMRPPWEKDRLLQRFSSPIVKAVRRRYSTLNKINVF